MPQKNLRLKLLFIFALISILNYSNAQNSDTDPNFSRSDSATVSEAYRLLDSGETNAALELFNTAISDNSKDISALLGQAIIFSEMQRYADAFNSYDLVVEYYPNHAFAWNGRGLAAFNMQDFETALYSFKQSTAQKPENGFFYESLAWTQMCIGEFSDAVNSAKMATLMYKKSNESSIYPPLIAYFSYLEINDRAGAGISLRYAAQNKIVNRWPAPVIDYLLNKIEAPELISFVTDTAEETEAHTYIGLKLRAEGFDQRAKKHIDWVSQNGDRRVFEYNLARALNRQDRLALLAL